MTQTHVAWHSHTLRHRRSKRHNVNQKEALKGQRKGQ